MIDVVSGRDLVGGCFVAWLLLVREQKAEESGKGVLLV